MASDCREQPAPWTTSEQNFEQRTAGRLAQCPIPRCQSTRTEPPTRVGGSVYFRCRANVSAARRIESRAALVNSAGLLASLNLPIVKLIIKIVIHRAPLNHADVTVRLS